MVRRSRFDRLLAEKAAEVVGRLLDLARNVRRGAAVEGEVRVPALQLLTAQGAIQFDMGALPGGYRWVFPKGDHLNVGSCTTQEKVRTVKASWLEFLKLHPVLKEYSDLTMTGAPLPYLYAPCALNTRRAVVCGDAAGLVDPLTAEGIQHAIESGVLAAETVDGFLRSGQSLDVIYRTGDPLSFRAVFSFRPALIGHRIHHRSGESLFLGGDILGACALGITWRRVAFQKLPKILWPS